MGRRAKGYCRERTGKGRVEPGGRKNREFGRLLKNKDSVFSVIPDLIRNPGEGRKPLWHPRSGRPWIPAFAGMTI